MFFITAGIICVGAAIAATLAIMEITSSAEINKKLSEIDEFDEFTKRFLDCYPCVELFDVEQTNALQTSYIKTATNTKEAKEIAETKAAELFAEVSALAAVYTLKIERATAFANRSVKSAELISESYATMDWKEFADRRSIVFNDEGESSREWSAAIMNAAVISFEDAAIVSNTLNESVKAALLAADDAKDAAEVYEAAQEKANLHMPFVLKSMKALKAIKDGEPPTKWAQPLRISLDGRRPFETEAEALRGNTLPAHPEDELRLWRKNCIIPKWQLP